MQKGKRIEQPHDTATQSKAAQRACLFQRLTQTNIYNVLQK